MATATQPELMDDDEGRIVDNGAMVEAITRGEIDMQIRTARAYPRNITTFKREALALACLDEETASSMFYVVPRGGKMIEGPSIRMAEIVGSAFGNLRYGARIV